MVLYLTKASVRKTKAEVSLLLKLVDINQYSMIVLPNSAGVWLCSDTLRQIT